MPHRGIRGFLPLLLPWAVLSLAGCTLTDPQSTFDPAGPVARIQMDLFVFLFWAAVLVFVVVEGALLFAVIRFRRKPGQGVPTQTHGNLRLEIAWTIAPSLLLLVIAVPTINAIFYLDRPPAGDQLRVNVIGHQWWWEFEYPDIKYTDAAGKERTLVTANELHVPVGTALDLSLTSKDVIHSFWAMKLGGKTDLIPTRTNRLWLQADEAGEFLGQCAELCGIAHGYMKFRVYAQSPTDFQSWVEEQKRATSLPAQGNPAYKPLTTLCTACHAIRGTTMQGVQGPDLTHFGSRNTLAAGMYANDVNSLKKWLNDPDSLKRGNQMAAVIKKGTLSEQEIDALATYLLSLR
ncbi:MAG: cytochrome c oxidase subunit II [Chloroflexi bacterium]|nr:cytochrome c oxidase subunit II [Chloroflexota bacterium]